MVSSLVIIIYFDFVIKKYEVFLIVRLILLKILIALLITMTSSLP